MDIAAIDRLRIVLDAPGQAGVAIAIMLVMFSVALGLSVRDFGRLAREPVLFGGGALMQIIGLPLVTRGLIAILDVPASVALGMIVVACCPGGAVSNLLTYLARGSVAYSVALTATSSVLAALLTPLSILFWSGTYAPTAALLESVDVSPLVFLVQTMLLLALPLVGGMIVAARAPDLAARLRRRTALLSTLILGGVIVYGIVSFYPVLASALPLLGAVAILHNAVAFGLGGLTGLALGAGRGARRALVFEAGIQNSGLALVILVGQLEGLGGAAAIAVIWGVWHLVAGALIVSAFRFADRYGRRAWHWT